MSFAGKVALITGGTKGIGRAAALHFGKLGAKVAVAYSSDTSAAESLVQELGGPANVLAVQGDASKPAFVTQLVKQVTDKFGQIDALVPAAGVLEMHTLADFTEADYAKTMDLNFKGPLFLVQAAAPHMPKGSHIVLFSSTLTVSPYFSPGYLLYNASKGAIEQMTRVLAKDLGANGICVNAIAPGPTVTDLFLHGKTQDRLDALAAGSPFKRLGQPDEVARTIVWLASQDSSWVSGQIVRANGAMI